MNFPKSVFTFACMVAISVVPSRCMENIETLEIIDCSTPDTLCDSIHKLTTNQMHPEVLTEVIKDALQRNGKSILMQGAENDTPLHIACWKGYIECVKILLNIARSIEDENKTLHELLVLKNNFSSTALLLACSTWQPIIVKELLDTAESINSEHKTLDALLTIKSRNNQTILEHACSRGSENCADLLREKHLKLNIEIPAGCNSVPPKTEEETYPWNSGRGGYKTKGWE